MVEPCLPFLENVMPEKEEKLELVRLFPNRKSSHRPSLLPSPHLLGAGVRTSTLEGRVVGAAGREEVPSEPCAGPCGM